MSIRKSTKTRRYYGEAYSLKCLRGKKSVDPMLDPPEATALAAALQEYTDEAFHAVEDGAALEDIRPIRHQQA